VEKKKVQKIGRPGYKLTKLKDSETGQKSILFEIEYPEITKDFIPRHRLMSSYEQKV
jgi:splicing factor 3A subunit 2